MSPSRTSEPTRLTVSPRAGILHIRPHMLEAPDGAGVPPRILLHSNESALGPGDRAVAAATAALADIERYPERAPAELAEAIGEAFALDPAGILCGAGSDEILARVARAYLEPGDEMIHSRNGYLKFPNYAHANGARPVAAADRDFCADVDAILAAVSRRTRLIMLANPDNPTGSHLPGAELRRLHGRLPGNVLLVVDSAYAEYVDAPDYEAAGALVEAADNVVMTRTFSKIFGLAGMRLGWLYGPPAVVDALTRIASTFPISTPALAAGRAALADRDHSARVRGHTTTWRRWLAEALRRLGLHVYPSQCNFLLARVDDPAKGAAAACAFLAERGIVVRRLNAPAYRDHIRITIGLEAELRALVEALEDFLGAAAVGMARLTAT